MPSDAENDKPVDGGRASSLPLPEAGAKPLNYREQFSGRQVASQFIDPCSEASKASMDCLDHNNYKKEACQEFFQVYRDCKKAWLEQRKKDRRAGN